MKGDKICYRCGYKYQLAEDYSVDTNIFPKAEISTPFIKLTILGRLTIKAGYAWDGASGPTIDTKSSMRGSLVHDALYQLMRLMLLDTSWRKKADEIFVVICKEDKMYVWRAELWGKMVNEFASGASRHENDNPLVVAP